MSAHHLVRRCAECLTHRIQLIDELILMELDEILIPRPNPLRPLRSWLGRMVEWLVPLGRIRGSEG